MMGMMTGKFFCSASAAGKSLEKAVRGEVTRLEIGDLDGIERELDVLAELLRGEVSYDRFRAALETKEVAKLQRRFGKASVFARALFDFGGRERKAEGERLVEGMREAVTVEALVQSMRAFSGDGEFLASDELREWLFFLARRHLQQTLELADKLLPWWVEMAAETLLFFGCGGGGGVRRVEIVGERGAATGRAGGELLLELCDQSERFPVFDLYSSRFSRYRGVHYGESYMSLLDETSAVLVAGNLVNRRVIRRVFEVSGKPYPSHVQWLQFCVALEHRGQSEASAYLFELLDERSQGFIDHETLKPFIDSLYALLKAEQVALPGPLVDAVSLAHELMDVVGTARLTRAEAKRRSEDFGLLVGALAGHEYFLQYETRDEKAQDRAGERLWRRQVRRQAQLGLKHKLHWALAVAADAGAATAAATGAATGAGAGYRGFVEEHTVRYAGHTAEPEISQYYELEQAFQQSLHATAFADSHSDRVAARE